MIKGAGRKGSGSNYGFTLIEVLVAFMVMSIAMVVIMQLFSGGLRSGAVSADYMYGIFHAQQKMEELLAEDYLEPGSRSGKIDDDYHWEASIEHIPLETDTGRSLPLDAYRIQLKVQWEKGGTTRDFDLETLSLGPALEDF